MKKTSFVTLFLLGSLLILISGCTTDSGFSLQEPTFDSVPAPFDISEAEEEPVQDGITKYIVEEGRGVDRVVIRDNISLFVTLRNMDGTIIYSSYQNDRVTPNQVSVQNINLRFAQNFNIERSFSEGLRKGLIGMKEGEKRVLIVPPSQGFQNMQSGSLNAQFREDTLRYDIELDAIL